MKKLRIAQLVLPWIKIPPSGYAGTERVVHDLTEGLVKRGHDVTVFSVGESQTSAKLEFVIKKALGLQDNVMGYQKTSFYPLLHVAYCFEKAHEFDLIHSHAQFLALPFAAITKTPSVHTFHRIFEFKTEDETKLVNHYGFLNFTSISNSQRIPGINFLATVYNGVDTTLLTPGSQIKRDHLLWVGRLIEKKGPVEAILVAKRTNLPLILAAEITEPDFYTSKIKKHIDGKFIKLITNLTQSEIIKLYQNAALTLVPIKWNEPYGLVPVESMACGTPVVAYANGGVSETVDNGKTGFLVEPDLGVAGLVTKTKELMDKSITEYALMSQNAREHVVSRFSVEKMVAGYEQVYYQILNKL